MSETISLDDIKAQKAAAEAEVREAEEFVKRALERQERLRTAVQVFEEMILAKERQASEPTVADQPTRPVLVAPKASTARGSAKRHKAKSKAKTLTTEDRAVQALEAAGQMLSTRELLDSMMANGYKPNTKARPYDAVFGVLSHTIKKDHSRLYKDNAKWGLKEWQKLEASA
jgi:hypothetical protein